jgi:DNA transformation protein
MSYWRVPDSALDDPDEAAGWGRLALEAARRSAAAKKKPRRRG